MTTPFLGYASTGPNASLDALWALARNAASYPMLPGEAGVTNVLYPYGDIRRYGAPMSGGADDAPGIAAAITNALALRASTLILPMGTITPLSNIVVSVIGATPKGLTIKGYGANTVIRPGPLVTAAFTLEGDNNNDGSTNPVRLKRIYLDGVNANVAAHGIVCGDNVNPSGYLVLEDIQILRFGGRNLWVKNLVGLTARNVYSGRGGEAVHVEATDLSLPTVIVFDNCQFRESTKGVNIVQGYNVRLRECVIESNTSYGVYVVPTAGQNATMVELDGCWLENNNAAGDYQLLADGSAAGTVEMRLANTRFSSAAKSIKLKFVKNFVIDNITPVNTAGDVLIDIGCNGEIRAWRDNNAPYATVVTNLSGASVVFPKRYLPGYDQMAYGATVAIDVLAGSNHEIGVSNGTAFTISNPTNVVAGVANQMIRVKNISGGAMGAITWGTKYKLAGAWTNPASANSRSITFTFDPNTTNWYEVSRAAADVPN